MLDTRDIYPLTGFLRKHKAHVARLKETHAPELLTVNGKMETLAAIQEGMASAKRGEMKPAAQVIAEMQAKYGLSR